MSAPTWLAIGMLGGLGAIARFLVDGGLAARLATSFPIGTLAVNLSGSFALGVLVGATNDVTTFRLAAIGLLGSYTTFSTWMLESQRLSEDGEFRLAVGNVAVSLTLGVTTTWLGLQIGGTI